MGVFSDAVAGFEECARLISTDRDNECFYALILIDALIDIYSHEHAKRRLSDKKRSMSFVKWRGEDSPEVAGLRRGIKEIETSENHFESRFKWLTSEGVITDAMSRSILQLHEYRNRYLHRLKERELDVRAFAKLYFYLFEHLFISIPVNMFSSEDADKSKIVKEAWKKCSGSFSTDKFRKYLVDKVNEKYHIEISTHSFLEILERFMMEKYNTLIYNIHFIIDAAEDQSKAIKLLEERCRIGKVILEYYGDSDDRQFRCTSTKAQDYLGKIRKMAAATDVHEGLKLFIELSESFSKYEELVFEFATEVDEYIQWQIDMMRGK